MKLLFLSALVTLALSQSLEAAHEDSLDAKWELFKIEHAKNYALDIEEQGRKEIFLNQLKFIAEHNDRYQKGLVNFTVGINKYADLTTQEFAALMNGYKQDRAQRNGDPFNSSKSHLPETVDWRLKGAVTGVKNQGQCGACWAFSATGSLEGQNFLKKGKLVSLSEQNLIDCSTNDYNAGCNGGTMDAAFTYIQKNNGIDTEKSYPYEAKDVGKCRYRPENKGATDSGYVVIPEGSEAALRKAVAEVGPISVGIDAHLNSFQMYHSGVYNDFKCSSKKLNHGVLAVGYGTAKIGGDYWLLKNSWGTGWGMNGYMLLARNQNNRCGITTMASYPKVK